MQIELMTVTGLTCSACADALGRALLAVDGVNSASVSLSTGRATVQFESQKITIDDLALVVLQAGYGVEYGKSVQQTIGKGCCRGKMRNNVFSIKNEAAGKHHPDEANKH